MNEFWKIFADELFNNLNVLGNDWIERYFNSTQFTQNTINPIMLKIGQRLGYNQNNIVPEHRRIDFVFGDIPIIDYAIEHENVCNRWGEELQQLSELDINIKKVLISYYHANRDNIDSVKSDIKSKCDIKRLNTDFLFIFGSYAPEKNTYQRRLILNNLDYKAFYFNDKEFEDLEDIPILRRLVG